MARENPLWGAPRIHGELLKLGVQVSQATVAKYVARPTTPPSQSWRTFLANHVGQIVAADFFVVPTATYRLLFVLVLLAHERRRIVQVAVTRHPTAAWTAQQFREAFPWDRAPRYVNHDRDFAFQAVAPTAKAMGIEVVRTAPRSPWQNAYVERFIGSARRECLDHAIPHVGGLHHRYERRAPTAAVPESRQSLYIDAAFGATDRRASHSAVSSGPRLSGRMAFLVGTGPLFDANRINAAHTLQRCKASVSLRPS
jgi:transposase InsO family protein